MANDFTGPTWYIDTPMTTEAIPFRNCDVYVNSLNWSNMALNDNLIVTDRNGRIIYRTSANAANLNINLPHLGWQKGVIVTSLGTGNVQIAVGK
jgi:hypothetical protein